VFSVKWEENIYVQGGPKVGIYYIVYKKNDYCIPTFGPSCII